MFPHTSSSLLLVDVVHTRTQNSVGAANMGDDLWVHTRSSVQQPYLAEEEPRDISATIDHKREYYRHVIWIDTYLDCAHDICVCLLATSRRRTLNLSKLAIIQQRPDV
jgi:predicted DNA-binding protein (UPF0278 family)